jgi:hypothetical protein
VSAAGVSGGATRHYFVDEAGDSVLFDRRGQVNVGRPGCSKFFILGLADVEEPDALTRELEALRAELLVDPYFAGVPSFQPESKKTAIAFHAKDDVAEVRREVFRMLLAQRVRFCAVVKDKLATVEYVWSHNDVDPGYRYQENELYDLLVRRLFKQKLHKADAYEVSFARRGASSRSAALRRALEVAQERARSQWGVEKKPAVSVRAGTLAGCGGLQAIDYFLWALQRLYERGEDRYIRLLWPLCDVVHDVDDARTRYGTYYTRKRPLSAAALSEARRGYRILGPQPEDHTA